MILLSRHIRKPIYNKYVQGGNYIFYFKLINLFFFRKYIYLAIILDL